MADSDGLVAETLADYARTLRAIDDLQKAIDNLVEAGDGLTRERLTTALEFGLCAEPEVHERVRAALEFYEAQGDTDLEIGLVADLWLADTALETYVDGRQTVDGTSGWIAHSATAIVGFGGPDVRVTFEAGDWLTLTVIMAGDSGQKRVFCPAVARALGNVLEYVTYG